MHRGALSLALCLWPLMAAGCADPSALGGRYGAQCTHPSWRYEAVSADWREVAARHRARLDRGKTVKVALLLDAHDPPPGHTMRDPVLRSSSASRAGSTRLRVEYESSALRRQLKRDLGLERRGLLAQTTLRRRCRGQRCRVEALLHGYEVLNQRRARELAALLIDDRNQRNRYLLGIGEPLRVGSLIIELDRMRLLSSELPDGRTARGSNGWPRHHLVVDLRVSNDSDDFAVLRFLKVDIAHRLARPPSIIPPRPDRCRRSRTIKLQPDRPLGVERQTPLRVVLPVDGALAEGTTVPVSITFEADRPRRFDGRITLAHHRATGRYDTELRAISSNGPPKCR